MGFTECILWLPFKLNERKQRARKEKEEKVKDIVHDAYYTQRATTHMARVLRQYKKREPRGFEHGRQLMTYYGLLQPWADSIRYLRNMKTARSVF
jgi:hypothetical protein